jgi:hypothetical protein
LALITEWEQVKAEMIVGPKKCVEIPLHFIKIANVDPLVEVESRDRFASHLKNDSDSAYAPDRRFEQIVGRLAHNNGAVAVEQRETHDRAADESPFASGSMHVCREDARDALRIV